jgi:ribokinase
MGRVGIIGDVGLDVTLTVSPGPDEKANVGATRRGLGGTGANAAVAASRLGAEVRLAATIGDDALGPWVREALAREGVGVEDLSVERGSTELAVILIEESGRRLFVDPGVGYRYDHDAIDRMRAWSDVLYLTHVPAGLVRSATEPRTTLTVVGLEAQELDSPDWSGALKGAHVVVANEAAASLVFGLVGTGDAAILITAGAAGATLTLAGRSLAFPAPRVEAVDATGAGDCFTGALCASLASNVDLEEAVVRAIEAATFSVTRLGTQSAFPTIADLAASSA